MDKRLQVVPGGTSGMGLATAVALGKFGPVLVGGRNEKRLETADRKRIQGRQLQPILCGPC